MGQSAKGSPRLMGVDAMSGQTGGGTTTHHQYDTATNTFRPARLAKPKSVGPEKPNVLPLRKDRAQRPGGFSRPLTSSAARPQVAIPQAPGSTPLGNIQKVLPPE